MGVVDPDRISPITPDPWLGEVEIDIGYPGLDGLTAAIGSRVGEILSREPLTFQTSTGHTVDGERLRVRFRDFESGYLMVRRLGDGFGLPAIALAFHLLDAELIEGPLQALSVTLGNPAGGGMVTLDAGTYAGIPVGGRTIELEVPEHREAGITANVVNLSSSDVAVTTQSAGEGLVQLQVEIAFEESGAEIEGTFLDYIPCWKCSTFEVPVAECQGVNIPCFIAALGTAIGSLGSCANPANWEEVEVASGPALPFEADLTSAKLTLTIKIGPDEPSGGFAALSVQPHFTTGVTLRAQHANLPLDPIQGWIMASVNPRIVSAIEEMDLGATIVDALEMARSNLGWGRVRGVYALTDGRWFIDAQH